MGFVVKKKPKTDARYINTLGLIKRETFKLGLLSSHLKTLQLPQPLSNGWESLIEVEAIGHELTGILRSTLVKIHGSFCGKPNK